MPRRLFHQLPAMNENERAVRMLRGRGNPIDEPSKYDLASHQKS